MFLHCFFFFPDCLSDSGHCPLSGSEAWVDFQLYIAPQALPFHGCTGDVISDFTPLLPLVFSTW